MAANNDANPTEQLLDFLVYAPVGLALEAVDNLPKYIERGRSQVTIGRFLARTVAKRGGSTIESIGERLVNEAGQVVVDLFGIDLRPDVDTADEPTVQPTPRAVAVEVDLPIPEYDSQAAAQIVKLLGQLTHEERAEIEAHELIGRNRVTILRKIAQLRESV
ncbi:MAG: hypothetical protein ACI81L_000100 [Verrucomicrobiales bacterium]|jgi:hypothetical protein